MKTNIIDILRDLYTNKVINKVVNETYIALIAKKVKCESPSD